MSNENIFDTLGTGSKPDYKPASFQEPESKFTTANQNLPVATTMSQLLGQVTGGFGSNLSNTLSSIAPVLEILKRDNPDISILSLSATEQPDLFADYIVIAKEVGSNWVVIPILLTKTIRLDQGEYPVQAFNGTQVKLRRLPAEILDLKQTASAIIIGCAGKLGVSPSAVKFTLNEYYLRADLGRLSKEEVESTLKLLINAAKVSVFTLVESAHNMYSPSVVRQLGYPAVLNVYSSKARGLYDIYGDPIPADDFIEVRITRRTNQNVGGVINARDDYYNNESDSFLMANAAIMLDLVFSTKNVDGVLATQFLQPNIIITQTNIGDEGLRSQGLGSKIMALLGALVYAGKDQAKWFSMAKNQQEAYQQASQSKSGRGGLLRNWQAIGTLFGDRIPLTFTASGATEEMAEILLDNRFGFVWRDPIFSIDLMRGSNSGSADSVLKDVYDEERHGATGRPARALLLKVLDGITNNRFSAILGGSSLFVGNTYQVVPAGVGDFKGETRALRECGFISTLTQCADSNDIDFIQTWGLYQDSNNNNFTTAYASIYERIYAGTCTNIDTYGNYVRYQLSAEFMNALIEATTGGNGEGYTIVDMSNIKSFGQTGMTRHGSRTYGSQNIVSGDIRGSQGSSVNNAYGSGSRFSI